MTQKKPDPIKTCSHCGKVLTRRRSGSRLEDLTQFTRRRFCDRLCFQEALRRGLDTIRPDIQPAPTPLDLGNLEASREDLKPFDPQTSTQAPAKTGKKMSWKNRQALGIH